MSHQKSEIIPSFSFLFRRRHAFVGEGVNTAERCSCEIRTANNSSFLFLLPPLIAKGEEEKGAKGWIELLLLPPHELTVNTGCFPKL